MKFKNKQTKKPHKDRNVKWYSHYGKKCWQFLKKTKRAITIQFSDCTPGHLSQRKRLRFTHKYVHDDLFVIAKKSQQLKYPSTSEWLNKWWFIRTMDYYSVVKRNELSIVPTTWMDLLRIRWVKKPKPRRLHTAVIPFVRTV